MDRNSAPPPSYQAGPDIPSDIFQPLLAIAQRQYDAGDVKHYYLTMLRHLRRMGTQNADAAYLLMTPVSDQKAPIPSIEEPHAVRVAAGLADDHVSPKTVPSIEEPSFEPSYEPGHSDQLQLAPSPQQQYTVINDSPREMELDMTPIPAPHPVPEFSNDHQQSILAMATQYRPTTTDVNEIRAPPAESQPFAQQPLPTQWFSPQQFATYPSPHEQPRYVPAFAPPPVSGQPPYHIAMSNTAMPLLVPFDQHQHQQQPMYYSHPQQYPQDHSDEDTSANFFSGSLGNSLGLSQFASDLYSSNFNFPLIDVIPSRNKQRRGGRALQKGVRRIAQGMIAVPRTSI